MRKVLTERGRSLRLPGVAMVCLPCIAALGCDPGQREAPVEGAPPGAIESCDRIHDGGKALAGDGNACTPFSVDLPFRVNAAIWLDHSWGVVTNDLVPAQPLGSQAGYARIDDTGAVVATATLHGVDWGRRHQLAWNGTELAYVATAVGDAHLAFLTADGLKTHEGPNLIEGRMPQPPLPTMDRPFGVVRASSTGYDVGLGVPYTGDPNAWFAATDGAGMPLADPFGPAPPFGAGTRVVALGSLGGATAIAWMRIYSGYPKPMPIFAGPPFSEDHLVYTTVPFQDQGLEQLDAGDGAGDGEIMMYLLGDTLVRFDGASEMSMPLRRARALAWTGDVFEIATMDGDQSGLFVREVAVTRDLATVCQSPVFPASARQDGSAVSFEDDAIVSAGADRVLFGFFYVANGVGHQALRQVCL